MKPEGWGFEMVKLDDKVVCYPILALFAYVCIFSVIKKKIVVAMWRVVVKSSGHVFSWVKKRSFAANGKSCDHFTSGLLTKLRAS